MQVRYDDDDDSDGPCPDPSLEGGMPLPIRLAAEFPPELVATPIEDIDPFYANKKTFVVISKVSVIKKNELHNLKIKYYRSGTTYNHFFLTEALLI